MELRHLRYFVALAEHLSFTRAAERVHVTQSTLSHQIRQLEEELECELLIRSGRQVRLTAQGEAFLESARHALREVENGVKAVRTIDSVLTGELKIAATGTFCAYIIPACVPEFLRLQPKASLDIRELSGQEIAAALLANEVDFGITYEPENSPDLMFEPLLNEEMVVVVSAEHSWAKRKFLRVAELHGQDLVLLPSSYSTRQMLERCFQMANAKPRIVAQTNSIAPMIQMVRSAQLATIMSEHAAQSLGLHIIPLQSPTPVRTPGLIWRRHHGRAPLARQFALILQRYLDARAHQGIS